jgi:hypothetical protein
MDARGAIVSNRPPTMNEIFKVAFILGLLVTMVIVIVLMADRIVTSINDRNTSAERSAQVMGDLLAFPEGWSPVFCEADPYVTVGCNWICQSQVDSTYRYCSPTINTVEAPR